MRGWIIGIALALPVSVILSSADAQQEKPKRSPSDPVRLQEGEVTGKLGDSVGSFKLIETEIVGTVEKPKITYIIPWREPEPFLLEDTDFRRGFLKEVYTPIDREYYMREIEIRSR